MSDTASPIASTSSRPAQSSSQAAIVGVEQPAPDVSKKGTKLRVKVSSQGNGPGGNGGGDNSGIASHLSGFERDLDSDPDEPIAFEEQFILKMPPGPECERLRELVETRKEIDCAKENVFFKFKDSRRGIFNIGKTMFAMKLVDLPCIIESQKTFDNRHVFKMADICQVGTSPFG